MAGHTKFTNDLWGLESENITENLFNRHNCVFLTLQSVVVWFAGKKKLFAKSEHIFQFNKKKSMETFRWVDKSLNLFLATK